MFVSASVQNDDGMILSIALPILVVLALVIILLVWWRCCRKKKNKEDPVIQLYVDDKTAINTTEINNLAEGQQLENPDAFVSPNPKRISVRKNRRADSLHFDLDYDMAVATDNLDTEEDYDFAGPIDIDTGYIAVANDNLDVESDYDIAAPISKGVDGKGGDDGDDLEQDYDFALPDTDDVAPSTPYAPTAFRQSLYDDTVPTPISIASHHEHNVDVDSFQGYVYHETHAIINDVGSKLYPNSPIAWGALDYSIDVDTESSVFDTPARTPAKLSSNVVLPMDELLSRSKTRRKQTVDSVNAALSVVGSLSPNTNSKQTKKDLQSAAGVMGEKLNFAIDTAGGLEPPHASRTTDGNNGELSEDEESLQRPGAPDSNRLKNRPSQDNNDFITPNPPKPSV